MSQQRVWFRIAAAKVTEDGSRVPPAALRKDSVSKEAARRLDRILIL